MRTAANSISARKRTRVVLLVIAVLLVVLTAFLVVHFGRSAYKPYDNVLPFEENPNTYNYNPYAEQIPLSEADLTKLPSLVSINWAPILKDMSQVKRSVVLPFDLHYYASPGDTEPAVTLKKGETIYVVPSDGFIYWHIGYGFACWPDYDYEWRFGIPFKTTDYTSDSINYTEEAYYYVKTDDLIDIYRLYINQNSSSTNIFDRSAKAKGCFHTVFHADSLLYNSGKFDSPAIHKELVLWW